MKITFNSFLVLFVVFLSTFQHCIVTAQTDFPSWISPGKYAEYSVDFSTNEGPSKGIQRISIKSITGTQVVIQSITNAFDQQTEYTYTYPEGAFFLTQSQIQSIKKGPISIKIQSTSLPVKYLRQEQITVPAGTFNCYKIIVTYPEGKITIWVEINSGLFIKDYGRHQSGATTSSKLKDTNILSQTKLTPIQSVSSSVPDIATSAGIGGALGLVTHTVANTATSSSFVGGVLSGVAQLSSASVLLPAVAGGATSSMVTNIAKKTFNAGPVETITVSSIAGTAVTVATVTLMTGIVPGVIAISAIFGASVVVGLYDYFSN